MLSLKSRSPYFHERSFGLSVGGLFGLHSNGPTEVHGVYYDIIEAFYRRMGCPVIVNTSFNVRGEPIVCTPEDAYRCFMRTDMDLLLLEHFIFEKDAQPRMTTEGESWRAELALD
jgi:carbamoyltransferase